MATLRVCKKNPIEQLGLVQFEESMNENHIYTESHQLILEISIDFL